MHSKIRVAAWAAAAVLTSSLSAQAVPVGSDAFDYADGTVVGQTGGTGWAYERTEEPTAGPSSASNWDLAGGTANARGFAP